MQHYLAAGREETVDVVALQVGAPVLALWELTSRTVARQPAWSMGSPCHCRTPRLPFPYVFLPRPQGEVLTLRGQLRAKDLAIQALEAVGTGLR